MTVRPDQEHDRQAYFRANLIRIIILLSIWAFVSFGCGIFLAPWLNQWYLPGTGYPLGFWFAQQGSIYVFVILIFIYVVMMKRLDRRYGVSEDE
ncbi:MAG: hypothetical protein CMJ29_06365 [Phycisphaerae bacterium]|nr:hypothetical protein [Phycisphaerae bacterium]|tara:strand:- start:248 stop:529 length:282 start_codon:yes stop_codon:yes gene_type:complete